MQYWQIYLGVSNKFEPSPQAFKVKMEPEHDVSTKFLARSDISCRITLPRSLCAFGMMSK